MDSERVINGLRDIDMFIAGRLGHETAKNFLRTIDETIVLLKEQEETINDLTETIRQLNQRIKDLSEYMTTYGKVKDIKAAAELLKEQEAETGHWIYKKNDDMFMCSCCEKYSIRNDYPYCHWCGAKMEGR